MGEIITFYSYKGGVGRTMALANIAVALAKWKYNVLLIDWDLDAPDLEYFFKSYLHDWNKVRGKEGVIDLLSDAYMNKNRIAHLEDFYVDIKISDEYAPIKFITAGKRDHKYFNRVRNLNLKSFYTEKKGGHFIEELRKVIKQKFDFILVDSRTGITDYGGICTVQLPDILMLLCTGTEQSLDGIVDVARNVNLSRKELPVDRYRLLSIPIPSRFDASVEFEISQKWLNIFSEKFKEFYLDWLPRETDRLHFLDNTKIPYIPYFSLGGKLPVLEQRTGDPQGLGYTYVTLAALLADKLKNAGALIDDRSEFIKKVSTINEALISVKSVTLFYGSTNSLNERKDLVVQWLRDNWTLVQLDLSKFMDVHQSVDAILREMIRQIGVDKEEINITLKEAKDDADRRFGAFNYEPISLNDLDPWSQHYMSHAQGPFFKWLSRCVKDQSTSFIFLFDHFEHISDSLQWIMEYYLFPGFNSLENVKCVILYTGNQQPAWKTFLVKDYVEIKASINPKLAGFRNPYIVGRPIKPLQSGMLYGRREIVDSIFRDLSDGRNAFAISAEPKIGKSSFLLNLRNLITENYSDEFDKYLPIYLSLDDIEKPAEKQLRIEWLMWFLAYEIHKAIQREGIVDLPVPRLKDFSEMPIMVFKDDFLERIFKQFGDEKRILLLIDEFDSINNWIEEDEEDPEFFRFLSQQFQRQDRLALIFSGSRKLKKLVDRYPKFFNPVRFLEIGLLSEKDTRELVLSPVKGALEYKPETVDEILRMSGRHPYITQAICHTIVNQARKNANTYITSQDLKEMTKNFLNEAHGVFTMIWNSCDRLQQKIIIAVCSSKTFNRQPPPFDGESDDDIEKAFDSLAQKNVLRAEKDGFVSNLFYLWLEDKYLAKECLPNITKNVNIHDMIKNEEGQALEYKSSVRWDYKKNEINKSLEKTMLKSVAGFLNADGGKLVIGIDDKQIIIGLQKDYNTLKRKDRDGYQKFIMESISRYIGKEFCTHVHISFYCLDDKDVCLVVIGSGQKPAYVIEGKNDIFYLRTGNATQQLNAQEAVNYISTRF